MIQYNRFTLPNGLRVIHNYDPSTAMVAVNTLYNVGSRDESPTLTGLAHLFEHLMFGGSAHISDFDGELEKAGGMSNAWTSNDFTNFYDVAPSANIDTILWLESDRMLSLSFSPESLEIQRSVVIEEFKQTHLNRPYGDLAHRLREMLYTTHPYRFPTIGKEPSHIEAVTMDDVKSFFYTHYAPNNAVLAISGNIPFEVVREKVTHWYAGIPYREIAPREWSPEAPVRSPRERIVKGAVPSAMIVTAFPMDAYGTDGYIDCDLLTDLLASGRSSRLYRGVLMTDPLFAEADASIIGSEEPGFLMFKARLTDASPESVARARETIRVQASHLHDIRSDSRPEGICAHEVERAINRYLSSTEFNMVDYLGRAQALAMAEMHGEDINTISSRYRSATPQRLATTAARILDPTHACTLIYLPE